MKCNTLSFNGLLLSAVMSLGTNAPFAKSMGWLMAVAGSIEASLPIVLINGIFRVNPAPRKSARGL